MRIAVIQRNELQNGNRLDPKENRPMGRQRRRRRKRRPTVATLNTRRLDPSFFTSSLSYWRYRMYIPAFAFGDGPFRLSLRCAVHRSSLPAVSALPESGALPLRMEIRIFDETQRRPRSPAHQDVWASCLLMRAKSLTAPPCICAQFAFTF